MSARAPRRRFATPFVMTLAAIPAAGCYVSSTSSPPPRQAQNDPPRDHREEVTPTNPPRPEPAPEPAPPPVVVANPPHPTVDPSTSPPRTNPPPPGSRPPVVQEDSPRSRDRRWQVMRIGNECQASIDTSGSCPPGALCNPPPPTKYACPPQLAKSGTTMKIIQRDGKGDCFVDYGDVSCPPNATCNPPRPQKVACPK